MIITSIRILIVFSLLTGLAYPLAITGIGASLFPAQANGSLAERGGQVVGSLLLAQKTESPRYFHPRPSAADYATVASGASNQGPISASLKDLIATRAAALGDGAPADLLMASGSGLDPHVSPDAARFQVARIASARVLDAPAEQRLMALVEEHLEGPTWGFMGTPRVNVLKLNLALDELAP